MQKVKLENASLAEVNETEFVENNLGMDPSYRGLQYPHSASAPSMMKSQAQTGSPTFAREDKASKTSVDNLKAAQIDRSKYLISEANARTFDKHAPERSSTRSLGPRDRSDYNQDSGHGSSSGQYPKKALLPPQRSALLPRKKLSEHTAPTELAHSVSVDETEMEGPPRLGKLDVTNVAKTINRYGTIPKGVRIGAYLESMEREQEAHGRELPSMDDHDSGTDSASVTSCPPLGGDHNMGEVVGGNVSAPNKRVEGVSEDSDPGIKQEPNLRPSAFVKSQSQHGIGDSQVTNQHQGINSTNVKSQYSGLLQRHKSDLSSSSKPSTPSELFTSSDQMVTSTSSSYHHPSSVQRSDTDPLSRLTDHSPPQPAPPHSAPHHASHFPDLPASGRPKPSPRFSRQFAEEQQQLHPRAPLATVPPNNIALDSNNLNEPYRPPAWMVGLKSRSEENSQPPNQLNGAPSNVSSFKMYAKPSVNLNSTSDPKQPPTVVRETNLDLVNAEACLAAATDSVTGSRETPAYRTTGVKLLPNSVSGGTPFIASSMSASFYSDPNQPASSPVDGGSGQLEPLEPVNIDSIKSASDRLKSCIDKLAEAGNKSSTNFMLLSEEVLAFYSICSRFIDALPPHAKFHVRELLSRMQAHSQNLKTYTSSNPSGGGKLLDDIQVTNKEIMGVIQR
ncbi:unnamed protein product [Lymnaea stagnalis]|uniref:F-actin binding domain-containing protein n=1 Tax=Lymnaea stagnalis TaxID=6523 RepID=A0AAV2HI66_LYMST